MIHNETSLLILAGGKSSRMGSPKHLLPASSGTVLDHIINRLGSLFDQVLVAGRCLEMTRTDASIVEDVRLQRSPLVGILSGLLKSRNPDVFVIGCDMPFVRKELIHRLIYGISTSSDIVIPVVRGYYEPLCAVYNKSVSSSIKQYLDSGGSKVTGFFEAVNVTEVVESEIKMFDPNLESFINLNTPRDYENSCLSPG